MLLAFPTQILRSVKPILYTAALVLGISACLSGQNPGYLGKRFFVKPEAAFSPAINNPTANNRGGNPFGGGGYRLGVNARYGLQAGYAYSRRSVVAAEANYLNAGMTLSASTPSLLTPAEFDFHELFYNLRGVEYGIAIKRFNPIRGSIAPMGFFTAFRLRTASITGKILDKRTTYFLGDPSIGHRPLGIDARLRQWSIGLELGQHTILANRVLLGISAELNVPTGALLVLPFEPGEGEFQSEFDDAANRRLFFHSLCMIKLGVGYLF